MWCWQMTETMQGYNLNYVKCDALYRSLHTNSYTCNIMFVFTPYLMLFIELRWNLHLYICTISRIILVLGKSEKQVGKFC